MKKLLLAVFFFIGSWFYGSAQWVSIPDTIFGTWLSANGYSACMQGNNSIGWQMDTTCPTVVNATQVLCWNSRIRSLIGVQYFDNLRELSCQGNYLSSLPSLPQSLQTLVCTHNVISALPNLPNGLTLLSCFDNVLGSLPTLPDSLHDLNCNSNYLTSLPTLPASLSQLYCADNSISFLPVLPDSLIYLFCGHNVITQLPSLSAKLWRLYCENNALTSLPLLPPQLTELGCDSNQLTTLPSLPMGLEWLKCPFNQLSSIPSLPNVLNTLYCNDNPNLSCLPELKTIHFFDFSNTSIVCLSNYPLANQTSNPFLSSVPLCDSSNINGCSYCHAFFSLFPDTANPGIYNGYNLSYGSNLTSYLWEFGDGATSTQQYPSHTYAQAGQYYVCLTAGGADCTNTYCDSSYLVFKTDNGLMSQLNILNPTTGISKSAIATPQFAIFPNPATNSVTISIDENMLGANGLLGSSTLTVYDITGRKISAVQLSTVNRQLSTENFAPGIYLLEINKDGEKAVKRLVKE